MDFLPHVRVRNRIRVDTGIRSHNNRLFSAVFFYLPGGILQRRYKSCFFKSFFPVRVIMDPAARFPVGHDTERHFALALDGMDNEISAYAICFRRPRDIMKVIVRKGGRDHFHMFVIDRIMDKSYIHRRHYDSSSSPAISAMSFLSSAVICNFARRSGRHFRVRRSASFRRQRAIFA